MSIGAYQRPNSAQSFYSTEACMKRPYTRALKTTAPAATAALPQVGAVVQEFVSADRVGGTIVCGGTIKAIGDKFGWQIGDQLVSTNATFATDGQWLCLLEAGNAAAVGVDAYINTTTMEVTTASGAGYQYIGWFTGSAQTNPAGVPAGSYAIVELNQAEV